jgi:spore germination protein YaaH
MTHRIHVLSAFILAVAMSASAQTPPPSIHRIESELHRLDRPAEATTNSAALPVSQLVKGTQAVSKKVFGYHPYWASSTAYLSYDYTALSTIGYFSYEVDPATGAALTVHDWNTTPMISYAHARGVKVVIVVTDFGDSQITSVLADTLKQNTLIASLISLLTARSGDGVNIDFEGVNVSQRANLVAFMRKLSQRVKAVNPAAEISMASPAVDWSKSWDFASLSSICDYLVLMGYDYYYGGSANAGPNAPLEATGGGISVTNSVTTYLAAGVASGKLLLGLPWYGFDWPVVSSARNAATTASAASPAYSVLEPKGQLYGKQFDATSKSPWFSYQSGTQWHQVWYDDSLSLAYKYGLVNAKNLGGIGIWALSYEGGRPELWQGMHASFIVTSVEGPTASPVGYGLDQNYPNPFNPSTVIAYHVPATGRVLVRIFDTLGREVSTLVDEVKEPGAYEVQWNAQGLSSGVYICRLESGSFTAAMKLVLQR